MIVKLIKWLLYQVRDKPPTSVYLRETRQTDFGYWFAPILTQFCFRHSPSRPTCPHKSPLPSYYVTTEPRNDRDDGGSTDWLLGYSYIIQDQWLVCVLLNIHNCVDWRIAPKHWRQYRHSAKKKSPAFSLSRILHRESPNQNSARIMYTYIVILVHSTAQSIVLLNFSEFLSDSRLHKFVLHCIFQFLLLHAQLILVCRETIARSHVL